ncbi:WASH complex subunit 1-like [Drosophila miranda]|uniref:WASH complex subunit 1-like n=1 Tax=Drosophila miranda TaxID=7229 RepID=UPI00143FA811|nr:WASH complex subunit 1-like [Drosophila miranda]
MEENHENAHCRQQETASVADDDPISFHVRTEQEHEAPLVAERKMTNRTSGLGGLPLTGVKSVPSLMRFNTNEFAYGDDLNAWKRSLPPQRTRRTASQAKITTENLLAPAPHSLAYGTTKLATPAGDLRYNPAALAAPAIDVPLDLPDLPGIPNDLQYEPVEENTPIAPSQQFGELPELPGLEVEERTTYQCQIRRQYEDQLDQFLYRRHHRHRLHHHRHHHPRLLKILWLPYGMLEEHLADVSTRLRLHPSMWWTRRDPKQEPVPLVILWRIS